MSLYDDCNGDSTEAMVKLAHNLDKKRMYGLKVVFGRASSRYYWLYNHGPEDKKEEYKKKAEFYDYLNSWMAHICFMGKCKFYEYFPPDLKDGGVGSSIRYHETDVCHKREGELCESCPNKGEPDEY